MSLDSLSGLLPYLVLTGTLMVLLLVVGFVRDHLIAMLVTLFGLLATTIASVSILSNEPQVVLALLRIDGYTGIYNLMFTVSAIGTCLFGYRYLTGRRGELEEFYILIGSATLGAMIMAGAIHFATMALGLEILSISLYALIAYPEEKHAPLEAALKYLVLSAVASTTLLFGVALIYNATGSLYFSGITEVGLETLPWALRLGQAMLFAGIAFKLSLVPFHMWTPDVYQGAAAPVAGYIATVSKAAVFAVLMRLAIEGNALSDPMVYGFLALLAIASMILGNLLALLQQNLKRLLAYSSIAHMGYLLVVLLGVVRFGNEAFVVEAAMLYLIGYVLATLTAFGVVAALSDAEAGDDVQTLAQLRGLFWRRPVAASCLTAALLSLMGMPLTAGFIGKFYVMSIGIQGDMWFLIWALILGSAISVYYYLKTIFAMTLAEPADDYPVQKPGGAVLSTMVTLGVAVVVLGIYPTPLINFVRTLIVGMGQ
jgi:NADH-quinone oxidoreductase subunit N